MERKNRRASPYIQYTLYAVYRYSLYLSNNALKKKEFRNIS